MPAFSKRTIYVKSLKEQSGFAEKEAGQCDLFFRKSKMISVPYSVYFTRTNIYVDAKDIGKVFGIEINKCDAVSDTDDRLISMNTLTAIWKKRKLDDKAFMIVSDRIRQIKELNK